MSTPAGRHHPAARTVRARRSWWRHPGLWLLATVALVYANQVLCNVYVLRVHHGDPSFIARYLPPGWFALAVHDPVVSWVAAWFPAPRLLEWTVLRVQAFLELPFVILAYLTVCRWAGRTVFRRARRLVWAASISYTITFCLVEWALRNPYTIDDIVIRAGAAVALTPAASLLAEPAGEEHVGSAAGLAVLGASAAALGSLVLVVYDVALLYNLGHLGPTLPHALAAGAVLLAARVAAGAASLTRRRAGAAGAGVTTIARSTGWFLVLFFVPALPLRYGLGFGAPLVSAAAAAVVAGAALLRGAREATAATAVPVPAWLVEMGAALAVGAAGAGAGYASARGYPEARLLVAGAAFFALTTATCALVDRWREHRYPDRRGL